ncbi:hypothetical protein N5B53_21935, partial [Shinella kummerowiae]|nr:hypothetical protein [Shinella kummerowiae]
MASLPALPRKYHAASIWLLYAVGLVPAAYGFYLGATGLLPGNPVKEFEHLLGLWCSAQNRMASRASSSGSKYVG